MSSTKCQITVKESPKIWKKSSYKYINNFKNANIHIVGEIPCRGNNLSTVEASEMATIEVTKSI